jgi:hypothetical protein
MAERCDEEFAQLRLDKSAFVPHTLEDELRVDRLCKDLLHSFYQENLDSGMSPEEATMLASGADYYVRDFVVSIMQRSILVERVGIVRQFAGNWYIVSTMEPNIKELDAHLQGIKAFYRFLHGHRLVSTSFLQAMEKECGDIAYYEGRIDSFWDITGDGYILWERECSLKESRRNLQGEA